MGMKSEDARLRAEGPSNVAGARQEGAMPPMKPIKDSDGPNKRNISVAVGGLEPLH
jgi:hypothetical protein